MDICGPSVPRMLGLTGREVHQSSSGWSPVWVTDGLGVMSIGFMLPQQDNAVIWRGPKKNGLIKQFLTVGGGCLRLGFCAAVNLRFFFFFLVFEFFPPRKMTRLTVGDGIFLTRPICRSYLQITSCSTLILLAEIEFSAARDFLEKRHQSTKLSRATAPADLEAPKGLGLGLGLGL